jgi:hypothetical protein
MVNLGRRRVARRLGPVRPIWNMQTRTRASKARVPPLNVTLKNLLLVSLRKIGSHFYFFFFSCTHTCTHACSFRMDDRQGALRSVEVADPLSLPTTGLLARNYFRVARDSAGTQTRQTGIVSCDRLVSTTIYPIRGLPITSCTRQALAAH